MSTTIDQKVVEMRFDNKNFEKNVQDTMSTLEKFKQKLNLTGASKGLENINTAANKVNMSGMSNAIETVHSKFSALEVMGITALANITNSAVNAGKRIASALTIDPITTGFKEYETQINAVQTILANTQKEGTDITKVNAALDELNAYADKTIYNFTEMTRNIGTFTAAGVKLDTSVSAIKGIANLAAVSGSTSQQASTAMYQLSQALASGTVKLMDWNSVVNAGMGGQVFQDALKETARIHGINIDKMIKDEGSFRETLKDGWLSADILTETLEKFTYATEEMTDAEKERVTTMLKSKGYTDEQIEGIFKLGNTATEAATKVKTFTQLWDVLKEAAQSGWAQTWRLIVGDFEQAKSFFTPLADFLTGIINRFSEARNKLLESALTKNFVATLDKIKSSVDGVKAAVDSIKDYTNIVNEIIGGKWGNGQSRWDKLTKAGYDWAHAQNLVNEKLGDGTRHATNFKEAQNGVAKSQKEVDEATADHIIGLMKLTEAELKAKGFTDEQIQAFKDLAEASEKTGIPIKELITNIDQIDGRYLLINSFKNVGQGLVAVFKAMKDAWIEIFPPMSGDTLFNIIAGMHRFSTYLTVSEEAADKFKRTLKGAFAILDMALTVIAGPIKIVFKAGISLLEQLFKALDISADGILGITANIGDAIVGFRDWLDSILDFSAIFKVLVPYIIQGAKAVGDWFKSLGNTEAIKNLVSYLTNAKDAVIAWFEGLKGIDNIPQYIIQGLANGLKNGAKIAIDAIIQLGKSIIDGICGVLGIHSPSTEFFEIGKNIILGLINGIKNFAGMIYTLVMSVGTKIIDIVKNLDIGTIFTILLGSGIAFSFVKIAQALDRLTSPFEGLDHLFTEAGDTLKVFQGTLKSFSLKVKADAIKTIAEAIAILAGAVAVLALLDVGKVWSSVGAIAALVVLMGVLVTVIGKFGGEGSVLESLSLGKIILALMGLAAAMLILSKVVKTIGKMSWDEMKKAAAGVAGLSAFIVGLIAATRLVTDKDISHLGKMLLSISGAMLLLAFTGKIISGMTWEDMGKAGAGLAALGVLITGLVAATRLVGEKHILKIGKLISSVAWAMLLLAVTAKLIAGMTWDEMGKAGAGILAFSTLIVGLVAATRLVTDKDISQIGKTILGIGGAMLLMALTAKIIDGMTWAGMAKAGVGILALSGIIVGLVWATKLVSEKDLTRVGSTIIMLSGAVAVLAISAALLSLMSWEGLAKGVIAVGFLSLMVAGLVKATKDVPQNIMGTMIAMTVAIGLMSVALATLSLIDTTKLLSASAALGIVMGMFALMIKASGVIQGGMGTLIVLTVAIGILAAALFLLAKLPIEQSLAASGALAILLLSMSAALAIASLLGPTALLGIASLALLTLIIGALGTILAKMNELNMESAMDTVKVLSALLYSLSGALLILSVVGLMGPAALIGIGSLAALIVGIGGLIVAIGALAKEFPMLEEFLNTGIPILEKIGYAIGSFVGNVIGGFLTGATAGLPELGKNLSDFMNNATVFINGAKTIDQTVVDGIGYLSKAIILLTAAELVNGVASFLSDGSSFASLGAELSSFMINALPFLSIANTIDPAIMEGTKALAETILILTAADILDGISSWLGGGTSLADFAEELESFGIGMKKYANAVGTIDGESVKASAEAAKGLVEVAKAVPNEGGWLSKITGENSLGAFAENLVPFGENLKIYSTKVEGIKSEAVKASVEAAKSIVEVAESIPNDGGLLGLIAGNNDLGSFAGNLVPFGEKLKEYSTKVDGIQTENVKASVEAAKALVEVAESLPNDGGLIGAIVGNNNFGIFAEKIAQFAEGLKSYGDKASQINVSAITASEEAFNVIKRVLNSINDMNTSGIGAFKEAMSTLGTVSIDNFVNAFINSSTRLMTVGSSIIDSVLMGISIRVPRLITTTNSILKAIITIFNSNRPKFQLTGNVLMQYLAIGFRNGQPRILTTISSIAISAINKIRGYYGGFSEAGKYVVYGFAAGITANTFMAEAAAVAMAQAALNAARASLGVHSPSKEFYAIGDYSGQGFVNALNDYGSIAYNSGYGMAEMAKNGLSKAITKVSDLINSDIDTQPTIRPVLDLSDVESGAGYLSSMFNDGPSVGVESNLRAISSGMNSRNQNGSNSDVVSAIDKLRKDLGNVGGNTYNINGVSADGDDAINNAINELIRVIKVERRI